MRNITIMVPAFNAAEYLGEAIESARAAFRCPGERIIVVDDGSSDETAAVALQAGVRCIRHPSNRGIASGLNTAIATAETEYVAWLSSDDLYTETAGDAVGAAMERHPAADLYFGGFNHIDSRGHISPVMSQPGLGSDLRGAIRSDWFVDLLLGCFINGSTAIMRRERVIELGLFDSGSRYVQDYSMWLLMAYHNSPAVYIDEVVGLRRVHEKQLSWKPAVKQTIIRENNRLLGRYLTEEVYERINQRVQGLPDAPDRYRVMFVKRLLQLGLYSEARTVIGMCDHVPDSLRRLGRDLTGFLIRRAGAAPRR